MSIRLAKQRLRGSVHMMHAWLSDLNFMRRAWNKARIYGERYPIDEEFLQALAVMPEASGVALGFDRVVMLATGATSIDQVQWVPVA
jgi:elongation factor P--beta-lysine ligase